MIIKYILAKYHVCSYFISVVPFPKISYQPSTLQFRSPGAIICSVTITSTVDPSSVKLTWINADSIITADNRVTISPTTVTENPSSFTYTRTIQFTYLIVEDEKNYMCSVTLGKMEKSQSAMLNLSSKSINCLALKSIAMYLFFIHSTNSSCRGYQH